MQELFRHKGDGTVVLHTWITDVRYDPFKGMAKQVCRDGGLEDEDMPRWTWKVLGNIWDQVLEDLQARQIFTHNNVVKHGQN